MDYSPLYCDMCSKSEALDELESRIPKSEQFRMIKDSKNKYKAADAGKGIFIPTDIQIHQLIDFNYQADHPYFNFIKKSYHKYELKTPFNLFRSFEQYALVYLMKSKYNKYWFNKNWLQEREIEKLVRK